MERVSTILSTMDYRHSLPNIKINDFILDDDGINDNYSPITDNRQHVANEDYYSSDFQSSGDERQSANKKQNDLKDRGKFIFQSDYHESSDHSSEDDKATDKKVMSGLNKQGKSKSLDNSFDSSDEKPTKKTLAPVGLTKRDKLMSRSFDGNLHEKMRSVSFTEPKSPIKHTNEVSTENTTVSLLNIKKPLSRTNRSLSESHLHVTNRDTSPKSPSLSHRCPCESRASIFSENQKCHCSCGKPHGSWNSSTKLVLPQIKIQNNGRLSYNRDFCYRVTNPRAVIEEAVIKRKGFCSSSSNNFMIKNKVKYNRRKQSLKKKNSGSKYKQSSDSLPVAVDASKEFKTVIRTNSDSVRTLKSK